jgi:hypothetical protein
MDAAARSLEGTYRGVFRTLFGQRQTRHVCRPSFATGLVIVAQIRSL